MTAPSKTLSALASEKPLTAMIAFRGNINNCLTVTNPASLNFFISVADTPLCCSASMDTMFDCSSANVTPASSSTSTLRNRASFVFVSRARRFDRVDSSLGVSEPHKRRFSPHPRSPSPRIVARERDIPPRTHIVSSAAAAALFFRRAAVVDMFASRAVSRKRCRVSRRSSRRARASRARAGAPSGDRAVRSRRVRSRASSRGRRRARGRASKSEARGDGRAAFHSSSSSYQSNAIANSLRVFRERARDQTDKLVVFDELRHRRAHGCGIERGRRRRRRGFRDGFRPRRRGGRSRNLTRRL